MNTKHLGDAFDFMKKDILRTLKLGLNKEVYVIPMFTDEFNEEQLTFYRNLTSADEPELAVINNNNRQNYFMNRQLDNKIVFIDPDTGIKESYGWEFKYLHYNEIEGEPNKIGVARDNNLLVVYDQSFSNSKPEDKVKNIKNRIKTFSEKKMHCFYLNAQACFAFISQNKKLHSEARQCLLNNQVIWPDRLVELSNQGNDAQPN